MAKIIQLSQRDLERIMDVEERAFISSIQTSEENILVRLNKNHIYLGAEIDDRLVGTLAFRYAQFIPDFLDFCKRNPLFDEYAEKQNDKDVNAVFVYTIGIVPNHRNGINAKNLLFEAVEFGKKNGMEYLIGDARVPSYNGSNNLPYEKFDKNQELHEAIDNYFKTGKIPEELIRKDPVSGFYLKVLPELKVLGITDENFWKEDEPCGGHMVIGYKRLK